MNTVYLKEGDLQSEAIRLYNERAETRLYHYYEPDPGLFIAETPLVIERAAAAGYEPVSMVGEEEILKETVARLHPYFDHIPLYIGTHELLSEIAGYHLIKGLLCAMRRKPLQSVQAVCGSASRIAVLEAVMNPINVGTIFRSAAALGMDGVLLTKGCSDPLYRRSIRVSMGNVFQIPWTFYEEKTPPKDRILMLKEMGYYTAAMALKADSVFLDSEKLSGHEKLAVILGSEYDGLCDETIGACDAAVRIPMKEGVDSLNVAAASAVAFWELRKK